MQEEIKNNPLDKINDVVETNENPNVNNQEVKEAVTGTEIRENTDIPTSAEAQAHIDAINSGEIQEDKSLVEVIYEETEKDKKEQVEKSIEEMIGENNLPEVILSDKEKEKQIENVVEDISKIIDKDISPEKVVEQLTEMFIEKEDGYIMDIRIKDKKILRLEEILESKNEEINKLKYSDGKVDVIDEFMGALVTTYKDSKSNPEDVKTLDRLGKIHLLGLQRIYSELEPKDIMEMINKKREANLNAIQGLGGGSEKNTDIQTNDKPIIRTRPMGLIVG